MQSYAYFLLLDNKKDTKYHISYDTGISLYEYIIIKRKKVTQVIFLVSNILFDHRQRLNSGSNPNSKSIEWKKSQTFFWLDSFDEERN